MKAKLLAIAILVVFGFVLNLFISDRLTRFCLYTPLKVLIVSLLFSSLLWGISGFIFNNESLSLYIEWKNKDLFLYPFFVSFICSMSSYSIFLCKINLIRNNHLYIFASFFIVPLLISYIILSHQDEFLFQIPQTLYYSLAFILPQSYYYREFIVKSGRGELN